MSPFGQPYPTENPLPLKSFETQPPIHSAQSFTSNNNPFFSTSNTRPQPSDSPTQGYNYARSDPFQQLQQNYEPVHHLPSYQLTSQTSAPFPHNTSTVTTPTSSTAAKPPAPAPVNGPEDHASSYPLTSAILPTHLYKPSNHTESSKSANSPIPLSAPSVNPSPLAASAKMPSDRSKQYRARLHAVNGIKTASKHTVAKDTSGPLKENPCPICGLGHKRPYHLESHFIACAESHGNPEGYFWNELLVYKRRVRNARERDQARSGKENGGLKRMRREEGDWMLEREEGGGKHARIEGEELRFGHALSVALSYEDLFSLAERVHDAGFEG